MINAQINVKLRAHYKTLIDFLLDCKCNKNRMSRGERAAEDKKKNGRAKENTKRDREREKST